MRMTMVYARIANRTVADEGGALDLPDCGSL